MLPVALTCPLWWVARWASRLLAGLALTAGLTVGVAGPAHSAEAAGATGAMIAVAPGNAPAWLSTDGATGAGGAENAYARSTVDDGPSCRSAALVPVTGVPHGAARPVPATGTEAVPRPARSATTAGPRAPPFG
ncbi:hypothetical protein [Micromonospora sp. NPDC126480]|uniref:hypothetical protein n=1 Tax=Micromonospora sp. NPDC126480 TaxID=3155312 RepID=UPI003321ABF9